VGRDCSSIRTTGKFVVLADPGNALLDVVDAGLDNPLDMPLVRGRVDLVPIPPLGTEKKLPPPLRWGVNGENSPCGLQPGAPPTPGPPPEGRAMLSTDPRCGTAELRRELSVVRPVELPTDGGSTREKSHVPPSVTAVSESCSSAKDSLSASWSSRASSCADRA
jgi:hypothetical protein